MFNNWRKRRKVKKAVKKGATEADIAVLEAELDVKHDDQARAVAGGFKSKLVWLGIAQAVYAVVELWLSGGELTEQAIVSVAAGGLTIAFRAITTKPLAEK